MFSDPKPELVYAFQEFDWQIAAVEAATWRSSLLNTPNIKEYIATNYWFAKDVDASEAYLNTFTQSLPLAYNSTLVIVTPGFHYEQPATQDSGTWCHVPLLVPQDTTNLWISSGGEQRTWQVGTLLCIPKSAEYVVHNGSSGSRVILRLELAP